MRKRVVPEEVTTDDVMAIFGWSRSEVSRRRRSGDLPEPDPWRGSERKPRWSREAIIDAVTRMGLLDGVVLAAFEGDMSSPVRWHRARVDNEYLRLPEMQLQGGEERGHLYRVVRYLRRDDGPAFADTPEYQLSLCLAIDDPNPQKVFNALLVRREVAHALGYGDGEAGTVAVILPADDGHPQLWFARIPAEFPADHIIKLERVPSEQIPVAAHLLGHPLPIWTEREITRAGAAQWEPEKWTPEHYRDGNPEPVDLAVPRELTAAHKFDRHCQVLLERIESGQISAPAEVPNSLRGLVHRAWEAPLMNMRNRPTLEPGWAWLFRLPEQPATGWPTADTAPALRWLATSPDAPNSAAEFATRYFGYDGSVAVAILDLNTLTPTARDAVEKSLQFTYLEQKSWLTTALERRLREARVYGPVQHYNWVGDPDKQSHPVIRLDDVVAFHVPRSMFPISTPDYIEVVVTKVAGSAEYTGLAVDLDGNLTPLPIHPDSRESVAAALTAAVWAPTAELMPGARHIIANPPSPISQITTILSAGESLHLDWDELTTATGPGPGPHADWIDLLTWHLGDPPVPPKNGLR